MTWEERQRIIEEIVQELNKREEIVLAVLHGGFLTSQVFRDIDIAVYTEHTVPPQQEPQYIDELREQLEKKIKQPVDIQLLDYAPPTFQQKALQGKILIERKPGIRAILLHHAKEEVRRLNKVRSL
ncbi:MAG: sugar transporter [Thermoprotei archaeon]|nr:MAG: sugar transporter [Thermoprotei archaeon]RLE56859.1 MAG: sugar transporter [Thermoprotei archaeon]